MNPRIRQVHDQVSTLMNGGQLQRALQVAQRAVASEPGNAVLLSLVVQVLMRTGPIETLMHFADRCLAAGPDEPVAVFAYAMAKTTFADHKPAIAACEKFLASKDGDPAADPVRQVLMYAYTSVHRYDDALRVAERLTGNLLDRPELAHQAFSAMLQTGLSQEGLAGFEALAAANPLEPNVLGDLCFASTYSCQHPTEQVIEFHRAYGRTIEAMKRASPPPPPTHRLEPSAGRRIRVGFVSGDLRNHSVAFFLTPLLAGLDRSRFELFCFQLGSADAVTGHLFSCLGEDASHWVDVNGLDMEDIAARVREKRSDVLIELSGHTGSNALMSLARNPAPLIGSYCGYPYTTGLSDVQFRIVDSLTDPAGSDWQAVEQLVRLDPCFLCYAPNDELLGMTVGPCPSEALGGTVTFGSFNAIAKFNPATAELWAAAMRAVPGSRLVLKAGAFSSPRVADRVCGAIAAHGVEPERIETMSFFAQRTDALAIYNRVDIGLDPFPYHGTTTTCEALGMGVPVISRIGDRHNSRVGLSLLSAVGLADLAVDSTEAFAAKAAELAADVARRTQLRQTLRATLLASPLCDQKAFCARFGDALCTLVDQAAARAAP